MSFLSKKFKIFNFWTNKAAQKTLEEVVKGLQDLKQEFADAKKEFQEGVQIERARANEAEQKLREKEAERTVLIHFYPGKELFVIIDGDTIYSDDISEERFAQLKEMRQNKDVVGIIRLLAPKTIPNPVAETEKEIQKVEQSLEKDHSVEKVLERVINEVDILVETGDFEVKGDGIHMKGIDRSIPKGLLDIFSELVVAEDKETYEAYKNFWRWVVLNPNVNATEDFYKMIDKYGIHVTKEGFILAYRWVYEHKGAGTTVDLALVTAISSGYTDVKKRKKGPKNFEVFQDTADNSYFLVGFGKIPQDKLEAKVKLIGNLQELYNRLPEMQAEKERTFTDGYTKTMTIRIGQEVRMNRKDCDESNASCSRGLHACFRSTDYAGYHGSVKLLIAICPRDIVSVPYENSKFRCCRYLPLAVLKTKEDDETFLRRGEGLNLLEDYFKLKVEELKQQAETKTVKELTLNRILPESLTKKAESEMKEEVQEITNVFQEQIDNPIDYVEYLSHRIRPIDEAAPVVPDVDEEEDEDVGGTGFEDEEDDWEDEDDDEDDY